MRITLAGLLCWFAAVPAYTQENITLRLDSLVHHQQWLAEIPGFTAGVIIENNIISGQQ
jgi:hypothetical protein